MASLIARKVAKNNSSVYPKIVASELGNCVCKKGSKELEKKVWKKST